MKAKFYISIFLIFFSLSLIAQNNYYYYKGEKVSLKIDENYSSKSNIRFKRAGSAKSIQISDIFYVKLKKPADLNLLQKIAKQKKASIVHKNSFMPLWYKLKLNTGNNKSSIEICNEFYETGKFADVDPAFMFNFNSSCSNDNNFGNLWGLNNTTNSNIDINICKAWSITEGSGVNVAVLDQGIDKIHKDLNDNVSSLSFDAQNGTSPSVFTNGRSHGTRVAGIIGAEKDNNLQVVGVAPKSKLISVSHKLSFTPSISEELANGINWAWQNGAHIINNSWGDQGGQFSDRLHSPLLEDAINNALNKGRSGLGTVVVFSSGNFGINTSRMDYPGNSNHLILTVGAINQSGRRSIFNPSTDRASAYGNMLDIVAPGSNILSTIPNQGIAPDDGTSYAAPHVAGVAALILSVNPNLTVKEVNTIIESTAQKVGGYSYANTLNRPNGTWNNEMGYGLVDAHAAVQKAQELIKAKLESVRSFCSYSPKTIKLNNNRNKPVIWTASSNVTILSKDNSKVTIRGAAGQSWVKATLSNGRVLTARFSILGRPVITFGDTSLTEALLNPDSNTTVNYAAVTLRDGSRIPFKIEGASSFQWKNTRRASLPELDNAPPGVHIYLDPSSILPALQIPYTGCYNVETLRANNSLLPTYASRLLEPHRANNSLLPTYASRLLDYYFIQPPVQQVSWAHSEPIHLPSGRFGVIEVELTATNACGCVSEANHYLVNVAPSRSPSKGHSLTVSPNPADGMINLQLNAVVPPPESPEPEDAISQQMRLAAIEACCRKFFADPLSDMRPQPECCKQMRSSRPSPSPPSFPDIESEISPSETSPSPKSFSYTISIRHYLIGTVRYNKNFTVKEGDSKTIPINVSAWPAGLYVLSMYASNRGSFTRTIVIR
ncbi:MAG: S8 family serine peptidase [Ekhidna sp.]|nr:S8 family serine peptidase [Ekhidna sp.]